MCAILLSIHPVYVEKIMNGSKLYEFRKKSCKRNVDRIVIYSTYPVKKIIGEADVEEILIDSLDKIWMKTREYAGTDKKFFDQYFKNCEYAVAYKMKNVIKYSEPRDLAQYGIKCAPQSFRYI